MTTNQPLDKIIIDLKERAKELNCLYTVQELLNSNSNIDKQICTKIAEVIPLGFQYPDICVVKISCPLGVNYSDNFQETSWVLKSNISVQDQVVGSVEVFYTEERPNADEGPFLKDERRLIDNISERIGYQILHGQLKSVFENQKKK